MPNRSKIKKHKGVFENSSFLEMMRDRKKRAGRLKGGRVADVEQ